MSAPRFFGLLGFAVVLAGLLTGEGSACLVFLGAVMMFDAHADARRDR